MPQVSFEQFIHDLRSGEAIASFPTDTVPALACRPDRSELIFAVKQRSLDKPLILMAACLSDLWPFIKGSSTERQQWQQLTDCYWPGALTLVLPASSQVSPSLNPKDPGTIGVRVPNHPIAQTILSQTGPLATTSANRSGQPPLLTMAEIAAQFPQVLTLSPTDAAMSQQKEESPESGIPSTVVRWTGQGWQTLRQGAIHLESFENSEYHCST